MSTSYTDQSEGETHEETEAKICEREEQRERDNDDALACRVPRGWYSPE